MTALLEFRLQPVGQQPTRLNSNLAHTSKSGTNRCIRRSREAISGYGRLCSLGAESLQQVFIASEQHPIGRRGSVIFVAARIDSQHFEFQIIGQATDNRIEV